MSRTVYPLALLMALPLGACDATDWVAQRVTWVTGSQPVEASSDPDPEATPSIETTSQSSLEAAVWDECPDCGRG